MQRFADIMSIMQTLWIVCTHAHAHRLFLSLSLSLSLSAQFVKVYKYRALFVGTAIADTGYTCGYCVLFVDNVHTTRHCAQIIDTCSLPAHMHTPHPVSRHLCIVCKHHAWFESSVQDFKGPAVTGSKN